MVNRDRARTPKKRKLSSQELDRLYNRGYFYGENSGYPSSGYGESQPDWAAWIELICAIKPSGTLVDLGCAYGFLVAEARRRGFQAYGLDISSYALSQAGTVQWLARADLEQIPIPSDSADIVTLFDVLEHLENPGRTLAEAARILDPHGLLVGATPDPIYFGRKEETHFHERPPSYWIRTLEELGFQVRFRFSVEPYNFQFLAALSGTPTSEKLGLFGHDYIDLQQDFVSSRGPVRAVPRHGWGPLVTGRRSILGGQAAVYLLNLSGEPQQVGIRLRVEHSPDFAQLRISFNSLVLHEVSLTSEKISHVLEIPDFLLPQGGHHLFFSFAPATPMVTVSELVLSSSPISSEILTATLPFDLFQRYRLAGEISQILTPQSILDVGGYIGDQSGPLANSADFLGFPAENRSVQVTDLRQSDHPDHQPAPAWQQPFPDNSFDLVVSLDVLEHLPPPRRTVFLEELDRLSRKWIVLAAPTASPEVSSAEKRLAETVLKNQAFLQEHLAYGLPAVEEVERFFTRLSYQVIRIPNGFLPRWTLMQVLTQHYFSYRDFRICQAFNRFYNQNWYRFDQAEPAYRTFWLVTRARLDDSQLRAIDALKSPVGSPLASSTLLAEGDWYELHDRILSQHQTAEANQQDLRFLINERQKFIGLLERENDTLKRKISDMETTSLWKLALKRLRSRF